VYALGAPYHLPKYTVSVPNGVRVAATSVARVPPEPPAASFKVFQLPTTSQENELMDAAVDPTQKYVNAAISAFPSMKSLIR
jgi:hypothetical protein